MHPVERHMNKAMPKLPLAFESANIAVHNAVRLLNELTQIWLESVTHVAEDLNAAMVKSLGALSSADLAVQIAQLLSEKESDMEILLISPPGTHPEVRVSLSPAVPPSELLRPRLN
jgi:hypothetical protein